MAVELCCFSGFLVKKFDHIYHNIHLKHLISTSSLETLEQSPLPHPPGGPAMDWNVPGAPELPYSLCVPEVDVELSIPKTKNFSNQIHGGVEEKIEAQQPEQMVGNLRSERKRSLWFALHFQELLRLLRRINGSSQ